jgi:hypothetical protein
VTHIAVREEELDGILERKGNGVQAQLNLF